MAYGYMMVLDDIAMLSVSLALYEQWEVKRGYRAVFVVSLSKLNEQSVVGGFRHLTVNVIHCCEHDIIENSHLY